jgi:hypothetical protein
MLSPGNAFGSGSYGGVRGRVLQRMRSAQISDHIFELVQAAYSSALADDNLVLSPVERRRLLADVLKSILQDMNNRLGR